MCHMYIMLRTAVVGFTRSGHVGVVINVQRKYNRGKGGLLTFFPSNGRVY